MPLSLLVVTRPGTGDGDTNQYITIHEYNNNALNYLCTLRQYALGPVLRCLTSLLSHIGNYHFYLKHNKTPSVTLHSFYFLISINSKFPIAYLLKTHNNHQKVRLNIKFIILLIMMDNYTWRKTFFH